MSVKQNHQACEPKKHKDIFNKLIVCGAIVCASPQVFSQSGSNFEGGLPEPGFSWQLTVGGGYGRIQPSPEQGDVSNISAGSSSGSGSVITSLDQKQRSINEFMPMINPQGTYVFSNRRTVLDFSFGGLGISHLFDNGMTVSANAGSLLFNSEEIFQDPYATNVARQMQTVKSPSFDIGVSDAFGLPLSIDYSYSKQSISNDNAGASLLNQGGRFGITSSELALLKRSSTSHALTLSTEMPLADSWVLLPSVGYHTVSAEGAANSAKGFDLGLRAGYQSGPYNLGFGVNYSPSTFDRSHPVFDKVRKDKGISYDVTFGIDEPFGLRNQQLSLGFNHSSTGSNINFYDSSESTFSAGWTFSF